MNWSPHVTVAALIRKNDEYLLVEELIDDRKVFNQPAGHWEADETLVEAVKREVLEETARPFTPTGLLGIYQWQIPESATTYLRFCFTGDCGEPIHDAKLDPEIIATHWVNWERLNQNDLELRSPLVMQCIQDERNKTPVSLDVIQAIK